MVLGFKMLSPAHCTWSKYSKIEINVTSSDVSEMRILLELEF